MGMDRNRDELIKLRVSVARLAQILKPNGVKGYLPYANKTYEELVQLAETNERGWNDLVGFLIEKGITWAGI